MCLHLGVLVTAQGILNSLEAAYSGENTMKCQGKLNTIVNFILNISKLEVKLKVIQSNSPNQSVNVFERE